MCIKNADSKNTAVPANAFVWDRADKNLFFDMFGAYRFRGRSGVSRLFAKVRHTNNLCPTGRGLFA